MTLHFDGFEQFDNDPALGRALNRAGYEYTGQIVMAEGRNGSSGMGFTNGRLMRTHPWSGNLFAFGAAMRYGTRGSMLWLQAGEETVVLWIDELTGNPHINGSQGGSIPVPNRYYYYEIEIDRGAGVARSFVNGRQDAETGLPAGFLAATELIAGIGLPEISTNGYPPQPTVSGERMFDDLYINSGPRLGPIMVTTRFPNYDNETIEWATSSGAYHADLVNRRPPGMNNAYVASDVIGAKDLFHSNKLLTSDNRIISTGLVLLARRSHDFEGRLRGIVGDNVNLAERSSVIDVGEEWKTQYITFAENASDTKAGVNAAPFGVQVAE